MKKLISGLDRVQLYLFKSLLESEGIACFLKNEYPPAAGELPPKIQILATVLAKSLYQKLFFLDFKRIS